MYHLTSKLDPKNHANVRSERFATEEEAIDRARTLLTSGQAFACVLDDDSGTIADDTEMAKLCGV